ncbi:MAG TPA: response regulator [Thermoanaerobaculia bacterium]|jgi:CheY-like chemotaxis protein
MFPFRRKRALLLDDDHAMRRLITLLLKRAGYRVDCVGSGNEAIDAIGNNDYTAILLDLMMPLEGGMTVIRHLRKTAPSKLHRVVVVSGAPDAVTDPFRDDIYAVVRKPFRHDEIVETVRKLAKT